MNPHGLGEDPIPFRGQLIAPWDFAQIIYFAEELSRLEDQEATPWFSIQ